MHHTRGGARGARGPSGPSGLSGASGPSGPLERFDIASELDGVPQKHNPYGYVWTAPRYSLITHAAFRARNGKPDVIDLHSEAPLTGGRVLRFKVPFVHTTGGTFFRRQRPRGTIPQKKAFAPRGDRTHDHAVKSRALYLLS
jgi:hypothetical protein